MSKVILLNGSPHLHGCTAAALDEMIRVFEEEGIRDMDSPLRMSGKIWKVCRRCGTWQGI